MATMRPHSFLILIALLLPFMAVAARSKALVGGWSPLKNLNDPHVQGIAEFAVSEYNKQSKAELKLDKVVKGETQVVSGTNYRLVLAVKNGAKSERYQAVVWEKPWENFKKLTSFDPVH
ncbi:cysteine proteinase inhibitor 1 [Ziziphus jujuba]|uniref:Cysteine proteinase inhibitor 1 n=2 Tax=Ziziphus jujuba TaxID=326968 RepID=A0A6P4BSH9_ZIZJJ|nr:cysteine proteinase inhibitor 1 [Ziziphus jujuba]KAH7545330.1 hypothetical protein FEM48_Zijuj01G0082000 [Ziziphus jujuba var. spinosa]